MDLNKLKFERFGLIFEEMCKEEYHNNRVCVEFVRSDISSAERLVYKNIGRLKDIVPFKKVVTSNIYSPHMYFIGPDHVIVRVTDIISNRVIYDNSKVLDILPIENTKKAAKELYRDVFGIDMHTPIDSLDKPRFLQ